MSPTERLDWIQAVLARTDLGLAAKAVAAALACRLNSQTGKLCPSLTTLERDTGLPRRTVTRALAELGEKGLIGRRKRGTRVTNYQLSTDRDTMSLAARDTMSPDRDTMSPDRDLKSPRSELGKGTQELNPSAYSQFDPRGLQPATPADPATVADTLAGIKRRL